MLEHVRQPRGVFLLIFFRSTLFISEWQSQPQWLRCCRLPFSSLFCHFSLIKSPLSPLQQFLYKMVDSTRVVLKQLWYYEPFCTGRFVSAPFLIKSISSMSTMGSHRHRRRHCGHRGRCRRLLFLPRSDRAYARRCQSLPPSAVIVNHRRRQSPPSSIVVVVSSPQVVAVSSVL